MLGSCTTSAVRVTTTAHDNYLATGHDDMVRRIKSSNLSSSYGSNSEYESASFANWLLELKPMHTLGTLESSVQCCNDFDS
jgi:hypothetical protein